MLVALPARNAIEVATIVQMVAEVTVMMLRILRVDFLVFFDTVLSLLEGYACTTIIAPPE